eukprot:478443-Rhodomonas_salina.2
MTHMMTESGYDATRSQRRPRLPSTKPSLQICHDMSGVLSYLSLLPTITLRRRYAKSGTDIACAHYTAKSDSSKHIPGESYRPSAFRSSILYFVLNDMGSVDPMYQFSLDSYVNLFNHSITNSKAAEKIEDRLRNLNDAHTKAVYECAVLRERVVLRTCYAMCGTEREYGVATLLCDVPYRERVRCFKLAVRCAVLRERLVLPEHVPRAVRAPQTSLLDAHGTSLRRCC